AGHIFFAHQLAVGHMDKVPFAQKVDEILPLLDIGGHIGRIADVGLLEQLETAVRANGHGQDQFEILPMLFAVAESDLRGSDFDKMAILDTIEFKWIF
ncbi:MAG: hypothetical protein HKP58_01460, partial [Desulfatitalea sp.]|nr:hypothetical protein [Desulfatitalea sp.]NNJ99054.1 hypothetical protein [Desulfatitalea sp.]